MHPSEKYQSLEETTIYPFSKWLGLRLIPTPSQTCAHVLMCMCTDMHAFICIHIYFKEKGLVRCTWQAFSTFSGLSMHHNIPELVWIGPHPCLTALDAFIHVEKSQVLLEKVVDARLNVCRELALIADKANHVLGNIRRTVASRLRESSFLFCQCWWRQTWLVVASVGSPLSYFKRGMEKEEGGQQMATKMVRPWFQGWVIQVKRDLKEDLIVAAATWKQIQRGWSPNSQCCYAI